LANHKSALKRHRQSERRKLRNNAVKSEIKTVVKKVRADIEAGKSEDAAKSLIKATTLYDRAVSKGILHRNTASRKIGRLSSAVSSVSK